jgi:hypothetical protein
MEEKKVITPDPWKASTLVDAWREPTKEEAQQYAREEAAFRRGYFSGVDDNIEAVRRGVTLQRLINYYNGKLWEWRFEGDYSKIVEPPAMPRVNKDKHEEAE